jgi:2'-hydroxyisoflavone reductase
MFQNVSIASRTIYLFERNFDMKLLILGGTVFLGRHVVESALARGHEVTLFNRGQHNSDLFPEVEKLRGDRNGDLSALEGRHWDAAIDTSGYFPRVVRASAEKLSAAVDHYTFISSISVYSDFTKAGMDENAPLGTLQDESVEEITAETYGPLKVLCERAAQQAMPGRVLIVRPGFIVGPQDPTDRFTYWPYRVAQGGDMLAPGKPDSPIQFIDVRDLASWIVRMIEDRQTGIFNATGPNYTLTMQDLLETCRKVTGSDTRFIWVSEPFLAQHGVELPIWVPSEDAGAATVDCSKAFEAGLIFRPLSSTVRDTLAWYESCTPAAPFRAGLQPEQEEQLLQAWRELR